MEMLISRQAAKTLKKLPAKHARQIVEKLDLIQLKQTAQTDIKKIADYWRCDSGEYRILFRITNKIYIDLIAKRNDDEIYRLLSRKHK